MSKAHRAGPNAEGTVLDAMTTYITETVYTHKEWKTAGEPSGCIVKGFPYTSIYGSPRSRTEFVLIDPSGNRTRIEVKWQSTSGSVDEKFPYLLENVAIYPEPAVIIVTGGGGAKRLAIDWLVGRAKDVAVVTGKSITVFRSLDEFCTWAHKRGKTW